MPISNREVGVGRDTGRTTVLRFTVSRFVVSRFHGHRRDLGSVSCGELSSDVPGPTIALWSHGLEFP